MPPILSFNGSSIRWSYEGMYIQRCSQISMFTLMHCNLMIILYLCELAIDEMLNKYLINVFWALSLIRPLGMHTFLYNWLPRNTNIYHFINLILFFQVYLQSMHHHAESLALEKKWDQALLINMKALKIIRSLDSHVSGFVYSMRVYLKWPK